MDEESKKVVRTVFSLPNAFSETGGFMTVSFLITAILISRVQSTIYFTSLAKSFYKYQDNEASVGGDERQPNDLVGKIIKAI
jgi:hypothetical protein